MNYSQGQINLNIPKDNDSDNISGVGGGSGGTPGPPGPPKNP